MNDSAKPDAVVVASRYHDFSCGHRVVGHEGKCQHLHGHNYRVTFHCAATALDNVGRVIDFSVINSRLCMWLEDMWDHRFLAWSRDVLMHSLHSTSHDDNDHNTLIDSIVWVPFNPTAENMTLHLLHVIAPAQLEGTGVHCVRVDVEETRKCSASASVV